MKRYVIARQSDFPAGTRRIVDADGRSIGVLNIEGQYYALRNRCPHQGAPLCLGRIGGTTTASQPYEYIYSRENEIIKCPWHGWEFEISSGRSVFNPHKVRVKAYEVTIGAAEEDDVRLETFPVTVEDGVVIVHA
jgi:nitrite reductase/ring-hydroxylating ferredoxin subunit